MQVVIDVDFLLQPYEMLRYDVNSFSLSLSPPRPVSSSFIDTSLLGSLSCVLSLARACIYGKIIVFYFDYKMILLTTIDMCVITTKSYLVCFSRNQGYQFCSVLFGMVKTFHTNSKNRTKWNKFHLILNLGPFWIFRLNSARNVPVPFHMFHSALEKPLNQIEPYLI
jgi:hypothetical protein